MDRINKDVFNLFMEYGDDKFELSQKIVAYISKIIRETKISKNNEMSNILSDLYNSINNAGWEGRNSNQITTIVKAMHSLEDEEYELTH